MSYTRKGTLETKRIGLTWGTHALKPDIIINHHIKKLKIKTLINIHLANLPSLLSITTSTLPSTSISSMSLASLHSYHNSLKHNTILDTLSIVTIIHCLQ